MAGILDVFATYFSSPITWVFTGLFIMCGLLIGLFLRPWIGNQVIKFMPGDHRFIDLGIDEETSVSIQCKKVKGMPIQRFFKLHPGFTGIVGRVLKKPITRFLGIEGTAYTWQIKSGRYEKLGSLGDALRTVWGEDFFNTIPERQQKMIGESRIQVTVGLDEAPLTPEGMRSISEEDIKQEEDRRASKTFWEEHSSQMKGFLISAILAGGTGFAICAVCFLIGIFKIPSAPPSPQPAETAKIIVGIIRGLLD
jgi:hypothetical protein